METLGWLVSPQSPHHLGRRYRAADPTRTSDLRQGPIARVKNLLGKMIFAAVAALSVTRVSYNCRYCFVVNLL